MKNHLFLTKLYMVCILFIGLKYDSLSDKTYVKITETENTYMLKAVYDPAKSKQVLAYMDKNLTGFRDFSFKNAQLDANVTLDSKITFYVRSYPGELELKFDKRQNNTADYTKFKKMCEGIRTIIGSK